MEQKSEKQKKVVQPAEEKTPKEETKPNEIIVSLPFDISEKAMKRAEAMGIPLTDLLQWAGSVEHRFQLLSQNLDKAPAEVVRLMKEEALKTRAEHLQAAQESGRVTSGRSGDLHDLGVILKEAGVTSGGGGVDQEMAGLMKDMFRLNIDRMKQDMSNSMISAKADAELSGELKKALAKEFAKKTAARLTE